MSVIGLPVNLGAVAEAADAKDSGGRFSLKTVEVELKPTVRQVTKLAADGMGPPATVEVTDYAYRVSATDTKAMVTVEGECGSVEEVPGLDAVRAAPNSATKALVPAKEFKKVFADAAKATKRAYRSEVRQVLASLSDQVVTFGFTDAETEQVQQTRTVPGKFPPAEGIVADTRKKNAPVAKFAVDPLYLAKLAKIAAGFCDDESMRLEFEVYGPEKPIVMTAKSPTQKVTMVLMPLAG